MSPVDAKLLANVVRLSARLERNRRAVERAARRMPKPVPWDWAEPRIIPLLSGPSFDQPGESLVRLTSTLGPTVEFGLDLGTVFLVVDEMVAERWERSAAQLVECGLGNLRRRAERLTSADVTTGVMSGRRVRLLDKRPRWASSMLLDPPTLIRLFGDHDQFLAAPRTDCLVSMPIDTPTRAFAEIAVGLEDKWNSLWLDPFLLESGELLWEGSLSSEDEHD
jgi:uncharacterized protein YtpQ (UPF0354 family)